MFWPDDDDFCYKKKIIIIRPKHGLVIILKSSMNNVLFVNATIVFFGLECYLKPYLTV